MTEFKSGGVTLKQGDCMEYLRSLPDKAFELAIVDDTISTMNLWGKANEQH